MVRVVRHSARCAGQARRAVGAVPAGAARGAPDLAGAWGVAFGAARAVRRSALAVRIRSDELAAEAVAGDAVGRAIRAVEAGLAVNATRAQAVRPLAGGALRARHAPWADEGRAEPGACDAKHRELVVVRLGAGGARVAVPVVAGLAGRTRIAARVLQVDMPPTQAVGTLRHTT